MDTWLWLRRWLVVGFIISGVLTAIMVGLVLTNVIAIGEVGRLGNVFMVVETPIFMAGYALAIVDILRRGWPLARKVRWVLITLYLTPFTYIAWRWYTENKAIATDSGDFRNDHI